MPAHYPQQVRYMNHRPTLLLLLTVVAVTGCARGTPGTPEPAARADTTILSIPPLPLPTPPRPTGTADPGLIVRLREGRTEAMPADTTAARPVAGEPLSPGRIEQLLARLPPLSPADTVAFRFPAASPPPPLTGRVVLTPFPPPDTVAPPPRPAQAEAALRVIRIVPAGETELAPQLTITFSDAMVPLTTVAGTEERTPPARLAPQPPGRWTWIDTRTLRFQPDTRFPMATTFTVEVPAGTRSAAGEALAEPVRASFTTPAPRAIGAYPALPPEAGEPDRLRPRPASAEELAGAVPLDPVVLIAFDQRIDPAAVLRSIRLEADGAVHGVRRASADEVAADSIVRAIAATLEDGRWIAVRPVSPLPGNADVRVVLDAGLPSAEGPRTTAQPQALRFRTHGPLRIAGHGCPEEGCSPGQPWTIRLTNPIDEATWSPALVQVEPALEEMTVRVYGAQVRIGGRSRPDTRYVVTLSASVQDRFGQHLEEPRAVTLNVGEPVPILSIPGGPFIVLDPDGPRRVMIRSQGHDSVRVRVLRVTPEQWVEWGAAVEDFQRTRTLVPPGAEVVSTVVAVPRGDIRETLIDVGPALRNGIGHAIVLVEPAAAIDRRARTDPRWRPDVELAHAWVQSTRIGVSASVDAEAIHAWVSSLDSGEPLAGAAVRLLPTNRRAVTAADGTVRLPLATPGDAALVAEVADDAALLPANAHPAAGSRRQWERRPGGELRWYVLTDRGLYQPGETVHMKGWLRELASVRSEPGLARQVDGIRFTVRGPRAEDLGSGVLRPGRLGGFSTSVQLPEALNLGHGGFQLEATGSGIPAMGRDAGHSFLVQEFRRPEYAVDVRADPGPYVVGDTIAVILNAAYYGGGGLAGAPVDWRVIVQPVHYRPPGWEGWQFGGGGWWGWAGAAGAEMQQLSGLTDAAGAHSLLVDLLSADPPFTSSLRAEAQVHDVTRQIGSAAVDLLVHPAAVQAGLRLARGWLYPGQTAELDVIVVDHEGRPVAGRAVEVALERIRGDWWLRGTAPEAAERRVVCRLTPGADPASCRFTADSAGVHRLTADVRDEAGRTSRTELTLWVAGTPGAPDPRREPGSFEVVADRDEYQPGDTARLLVQPPFHPAEAIVSIRGAGVIAHDRLRIETPAHELKLPITDEHIGGVRVRVEVVDAESGVRHAFGQTAIAVPPHARTLDVRIAPRDTLAAPGSEVTIDVEVRDADGRAAAGAEVAMWMVDEAILGLADFTLRDPLQTFWGTRYGWVQDQQSRLWVVHWPRSAGPGTLSGVVIDAGRGIAIAGAAVRIEGTALEARTAFDGSFTLRDVAPGEHVLVIRAPDGTTGRRTVSVPAGGAHVGNLMLGESGIETAGEIVLRRSMDEMQAAAIAPPPAPPPPPAPFQLESIVATGAGGAQQQVELRTDFAPLAFFEPSLTTDARGRVQVTARLPQSLTRYRIMAVAVAGAQHFGTGEASVTARKDLMVRIAAPRFLNHGDVFELPVLLQNLTSRSRTVDVAARAGGIDIAGSAGRTLTLAPGARAEIRFDASAPVPGDAQVQVIAVADDLADAAATVVPVYTPATLEAFATYGSIDGSAPVVLPLERPANVIDVVGGLEVSITATALHSLTDAVLFLHRYPFSGSEHLASRVIAVAALRDVLAAFGAEGLPDPDELVAVTERDIAELVARQGADGGWPFWVAGAPSLPFTSIHVAHALERARGNGFDVPQEVLGRAAAYLRDIDSHTARWPFTARRSAAAYALYVRARIGDDAAVEEARRMASAAPDRVGGELSVEAAGWLLHVLASDPSSRTLAGTLEQTLLNRLVETAGAVTFAERYDDGEHLLLHSRRRTDAVVLEALIAAGADADIVTRLAQSLLAHRVAGRWSGTQENSWVLLALDRYFRTYEATTPAFESRVWLGDEFAGANRFEGRTTERQHIDVPMPQLLRSDAAELVIAREGAGRMYYRAGIRYAPADRRVPAADRGFEVTRVYEAVDDPADVQRADDGTWRVRAGARVRVRIGMIAPSVRYHAALVDPLPAGLEPLNPELSGTGFTDDPGARGPRIPGRLPATWRPAWFDHQNLRDDRAEAFASLLPPGDYEYSYLARATTPGTFIVPPARAEMMYQPETFGRGAGDVVIVEER
ncbi:MAG TPA: Ig-like domain-containing protein [Longimicrobiales bacterium]